MPVEALLASLGTSPAGLNEAEGQARRRRFGPNSVRPRVRPTALRLFADQFRSAIVLILLVATLVSAVMQDWADAAIVLAIVLGSALLTFYQEYSAGNATEKLLAQVRMTAKVLRDNRPLVVP